MILRRLFLLRCYSFSNKHSNNHFNIPRMASTSTSVNLLDILSTSVSAAERAASVIREVMRKGDLGVVDKGINDYQTEADRSAQRIIVSCLKKRFPGILVIGEENLDDEDADQEELKVEALSQTCPSQYQSIPLSSIVVWVDPLDGTSEYTQGLLEHVTCLIGIAVEGEAVAGVINQPYYNYKKNEKIGRTIWSCLGLGVFGIEMKPPPKDKLILTTTRSHSNKEINDCLESMKPDEILRVGGAGHKVLLVIEGKAHAYVFPSSGCKKWDTCAPEAVLRSRGGFLTDILGRDIKYHRHVQHLNTGGVLATTDKETYAKCLSLIPSRVKEKFLEKELMNNSCL